MRADSRIFVAGHMGLLGSQLTGLLGEKGFENILTYSHDELDLTNPGAVNALFDKERPEYVFLAAGLTGGIQANRTSPATFLHTNIAIQDSVMEAAHKHDIKHLVFYGSTCIYPRECPQPMGEGHLFGGPIETTSEAYAIAKTAGIVACRSYNRQYGYNRFIALLPNSMYGPNDNFDLESSHVLSALMRKLHDAQEQGKPEIQLWGSGAPRREFVFSRDVAEASLFAVQCADKLDNTHYNVGTGTDYSIKELAHKLAGVVGYKGKITWDTSKPDGTMRKLLDSSKFQSLGWSPSMSFDEGLKQTYNWFLNNQPTG
jgi:GDP-L-fucose synthase